MDVQFTNTDRVQRAKRAAGQGCVLHQLPLHSSLITACIRQVPTTRDLGPTAFIDEIKRTTIPGPSSWATGPTGGLARLHSQGF